jgi:hypothetical protein
LDGSRVNWRLACLVPLLVGGCTVGPPDNSPQAQCERQANEDPTVQAIYRGEQGDYTQIGPARSNLLWTKRQATLKCMQQKGLAPPGGVEPIRPPMY